ncbi:hypothetical protein ESCO_000795 [Escovopsis weberi]|uniref:Uncharacterized protein n=1 Tax=Escovopsis weberi TaxID=150374 RepID=A0A0M8MXH9_ESCWE|nr:hypothetical protein ESCO_000795 [Escovopsis weberi]
MAASQLTQTVIDAFNALADEVQALADHKIVLEHKLRFAHEQFQSLADKYAPAAPEIAKTLANLQPPPYHSVDDTSLVPLLKRAPSHAQHQVALIIRDGRRAAARLVSLREASKTPVSTRDTLSQPSLVEPSMPTTLEQDFTVEGRKGRLQCPFSKDRIADDATQNAQPENGPSPAAIASQDAKPPSLAEDAPSVNGAQAGKCPIRFIDERSPEEIAQYVEAHKHDLPRSHELCLRRYQRNDEQIRKLDSKYGNIVSMIEDLSQLHKPMLPEGDQTRRRSVETGPSHDRVETWAQEVGASAGPEEAKPDDALEDPDRPSRSGRGPADPEAAPPAEADDDDDRHGRFDRVLKEVRVGESPSRPWGISVPFYDPSDVESRPAFIDVEASKSPHGVPQMVFTGPVFIGYPMEQAIQFMNQYQRRQ